MKKIIFIGLFCLVSSVFAQTVSVSNNSEKSIPEKKQVPDFPPTIYAVMPSIVDGKNL